MSKIKPYIPAIAWTIVIGVLSGYPGNHIPKVPVWQFDKLVHSVIYAALSFFLLLGFSSKKVNKGKLGWGTLAIFLSVFYGGLMEISQHYIFINRSGNWYDFYANTFGAIFGVFLYPFVTKLLPINRWLNIP